MTIGRKIFSSIFLAVALTTLRAEEPSQYALSVPGISSVVMIRVPSAFRPAQTQAEAETRRELADALSTNPLGKAVVSDVLSTDWTRPKSLPILYIGTLPSAEKEQGKFTDSYWDKAKEMFTTQSKLLVITLNQQMLIYGLPDCSAAMNRTIADTDKNSVVFFGFAPTGKASEAAPMLLGRKLKFVRNSIVLFETAVDATKPDAMAVLENIMRTVDAPAVTERYRNQEHNFSLDPPLGWTVKKSEQPNTLIKFVYRDATGHIAVLSIATYADWIGAFTADNVYAILKNEYPDFTFRRIGSGVTKIHSMDAVWNLIEITDPPKARIIGRHYHFRRNGKLWRVTATTDSGKDFFATVLPTMEKAIATIKFGP